MKFNFSRRKDSGSGRSLYLGDARAPVAIVVFTIVVNFFMVHWVGGVFLLMLAPFVNLGIVALAFMANMFLDEGGFLYLAAATVGPGIATLVCWCIGYLQMRASGS